MVTTIYTNLTKRVQRDKITKEHLAELFHNLHGMVNAFFSEAHGIEHQLLFFDCDLTGEPNEYSEVNFPPDITEDRFINLVQETLKYHPLVVEAKMIRVVSEEETAPINSTSGEAAICFNFYTRFKSFKSICKIQNGHVIKGQLIALPRSKIK